MVIKIEYIKDEITTLGFFENIPSPLNEAVRNSKKLGLFLALIMVFGDYSACINYNF